MTNESNEQGDDMLSGLGVAERDLLMQQLHELPDAPPPREVWERLRAQAEAEGLITAPQRRLAPWLAGAGIAAAVVLAVIQLPLAPGLPGQGPAEEGAFPTEPAFVENHAASNLEALMVASEMLEQNLRALPAQPRVMRAGTAATIDQLEGRIAAIDSVLSDPQAGLSDEETELYWRERVRLMDSLVQVRYAQARRNSL